MFDIAVLIVLAVMSFRIVRTLRREMLILREFRLHQGLAFLVLLFPLGPLVLVGTTFKVPFPFAHVAAAACFIPGMLLARAQTRTLDSAGTDRVQGVQGALAEAFGAALLGLIYVSVAFAIAFGARSLATVG